MRRLSVLALLALGGVFAQRACGQIPAFSGADGAAAYVSGGRGGIVYHVTKLDLNYNDSAPGTLRYGLNSSNFPVGTKRTIVFDVAGTFWLGRYGAENGHDNGWDTSSRYNLGSDVTIAGQTAPGPVYIMGGLVKASGNNSIMRNVTIAPGYGMRSFSKPEDGVFPAPGDFPDSYVYDAIDITGTNQMIDHVSTLYATDETISANELANNVTIQYSNISQGQNYPQADAEASGTTYTGHALGSLLQGGTNSKFSVHHNLYAHQKGRLPRVGSEVGTGAYNDFRNNVFYNWLSTAGSGASGQPSFNNFVANFWRSGNGGDDPVGGSSTAITNRAGGTSIFSGSNSTGTRIYHSGNLKDTNKDGDPNDTVTLTNSDFGSSSFQANPLWSGGVVTYNGTIDSAGAAYDRVLNYVGSNWWTRDNVINTPDERIINEVRTGTGKIMAWADDPFNGDVNEGKEWRDLLDLRANPVTGAAPFNRGLDWDADGDGMPNAWEAEYELDENAPENNADFDNDGYTNLEEYLNDVAAWPASGFIVFDATTNSRYAQITNWDSNPDPARDLPWQPSRYDTAVINSGTVVLDSVGQHAGNLLLGTNPGDNATLNITAGWIKVEDAPHGLSDGTTVIGDNAGATAVLNLSGGKLTTKNLLKGIGGTFNFTGGTLSAETVGFDLLNQGGEIAPGNSPGVTLVMGDLTMAGGSIEIEIAGNQVGQYDQVLVTDHFTGGGTLEVLLDDYAPVSGDVFELFGFASASGDFSFSLPSLDVGLSWDTSDLLATGELSVVESIIEDADFDGDGDVDGRDFLIWQRGFGLSEQENNSLGDANGDGNVNEGDLAIWQMQYVGPGELAATQTAVPEPSSLVICGAMLAFCLTGRKPAR
jgi:hypothetical protein